METFDLPAADAVYTWTRSGERPQTRLHQDVSRVYNDALRRCFEETGAPLARSHFIRFVNGFQYARAADEPQEAADERLQRHRDYAERFRERGTTYYEAEIRPEVEEIVARLRRHPRATAPLDVLLAHLDECVRGWAIVMADRHWRMAFAGPSLSGGWPDVYHEITGRPASEAVLFQSGTPNPATKLVRRLRALARIAREDGEVSRIVAARDMDAVNASDHPAVRRFRSSFRAMMSGWGLRIGHGWGSATEFASPTWSMSPQIPLGIIASYARTDLDAIERREAAARRDRRRVLRQVRRELRDDADRLARFEDALAYAVWTAWVMEDHNHLMDQSSAGVLREAVDLVGRGLVRAGRIDEPDDALHLSLEELRSADGDLRGIVASRRKEWAEQARLDAPEILGAAPTGAPSFMHDQGEGLDGDVLRGVAASPGRYTGRARVRMPSPEPPDVEEGDVLVAVDAGPAWTPVFAILGAVVLDKGAAWQHAGVMAREFGIPAVTGTKEGTTTIADGQTITVDGAQGVVELGTET